MDIKQKPTLHADWIDRDAKNIVRILQESGFKTYLVGGCVRDLLAGIHPKDFDIVTNAAPQQVKRKVPHAYIIGRRFRLVLVKRGNIQYEVATFRRNATEEETIELANEEQTSLPQGDNLFGSPEEDALRRDFTINGLFYDPIKDELIDYCGGMKDINASTLRMIGDPDERLIEDPIRILRAVRLSHKLNFKIEENLRASILKHAKSLQKSVLPRRREEFLKLLRLNEPARAFLELYDLGVLEQIAPSLIPIFDDKFKLEVFSHYLNRSKELAIDVGNPTKLFGVLILGYLRAEAGDSKTKLDMLINNENSPLASLLRDELSVFKAEQALIFKALDLQSNFKNIESFRRKGERRQMAFLTNEIVPYSLHLAEKEFTLSPNELLFWKSHLSKY